MAQITHHMISLPKLKQIVKAQFIFEKPKQRASETLHEFNERKKLIHELHTCEQREGIRSLALIVFCRIGFENGYTVEQMANYLKMEERSISYFLTVFERYEKERHKSKSVPVVKTFIKYGMVTNAMRSGCFRYKI